nr:immunoglobulin heavy chain junction region [Mus musculus]MBK4186497.1 immunoglobulin heavy chain junction region [Mus musculus]MBK4188153.1 immunoglobulin heavy chain junction region [Mus musculus]MBK4196353.1 immunoglobulin heavy chain junction region [Mus musculus]MBK4196717.1 immunoglobulin heavy chain junction region [Mus musculus]
CARNYYGSSDFDYW